MTHTPLSDHEARERLERENMELRAAVTLAIKHIEGKGETFSERGTVPVLQQLRMALGENSTKENN